MAFLADTGSSSSSSEFSTDSSSESSLLSLAIASSTSTFLRGRPRPRPLDGATLDEDFLVASCFFGAGFLAGAFVTLAATARPPLPLVCLTFFAGGCSSSELDSSSDSSLSLSYSSSSASSESSSESFSDSLPDLRSSSLLEALRRADWGWAPSASPSSSSSSSSSSLLSKYLIV